MRNFHLGHGLLILDGAVMVAGIALQNAATSLGVCLALIGAVLISERDLRK